MKKKTVALFTALAILIAALCLFADLNRYTYKTKTVSDKGEDGGIVFSITTFDGRSETEPFVKSFGHTWLSLENRTDASFFLLDNEIKSGELITFSVWAIAKHFGVVFNLEPAFISDHGRYKGRQSLSIRINENMLGTIESYIKENDRWSLLKNCSFWSVALWNEVAGDEYRLKTQTVLYSPGRLRRSLEEFNCIENDMDFSKAEGVFFYRNGERKELELCS